jgi:hypothetical protein
VKWRQISQQPRSYALIFNTGDELAQGLKLKFLHRDLPSATIAARTASTGDVTGGTCSTAKNRRLSLPSIGDDQA